MSWRRWHAVSFLVFALLLLGGTLLGCAPKIGDDCSSSSDCSMTGDRLCDTTQPGGYCTVFNCEPDTCPEEAQCVSFDQYLDPACVHPQQWARFERTFCMRRCDEDDDCRAGYVCFDLAAQPNPWEATIADLNPEGTKVCLTPWVSAPSTGGLTEVCNPYDGTFPEAGPAFPDAGDAAADTHPQDDAGATDAPDESDASGSDTSVSPDTADEASHIDASPDTSTSDADLDGGVPHEADSNDP